MYKQAPAFYFAIYLLKRSAYLAKKQIFAQIEFQPFRKLSPTRSRNTTSHAQDLRMGSLFRPPTWKKSEDSLLAACTRTEVGYLILTNTKMNETLSRGMSSKDGNVTLSNVPNPRCSMLMACLAKKAKRCGSLLIRLSGKSSIYTQQSHASLCVSSIPIKM